MDNLALLQNFSNAQRQLSQVKQLQVRQCKLQPDDHGTAVLGPSRMRANPM